MKHSIKREQSHARMSFAEYENQRSLAEGESNVRATLKHMKLSFHLILTLTAMLTMAQTAWAVTEEELQHRIRRQAPRHPRHHDATDDVLTALQTHIHRWKARDRHAAVQLHEERLQAGWLQRRSDRSFL